MDYTLASSVAYVSLFPEILDKKFSLMKEKLILTLFVKRLYSLYIVDCENNVK